MPVLIYNLYVNNITGGAQLMIEGKGRKITTEELDRVLKPFSAAAEFMERENIKFDPLDPGFWHSVSDGLKKCSHKEYMLVSTGILRMADFEIDMLMDRIKERK